MIRHFRKIRQKLLSEGKTGAYLKYAIGEIALVVIGILIALQINNWNENRKAVKYEYKLVDQMIEQTVADSILFSDRINNLKMSIKNLGYYIDNKQEIASSLKPRQIDEFLSLSVTMNDGSFLVRNHLEDFKKVNDLELREQLMEYSYMSTMQDKAIEIVNYNTLNYNVPLLLKYHGALSRYDATFTLNEMKEFLMNPELEAHFDMSTGWLNNVLIQVENLYNKNQEVLERLKQYKSELGN